jgi:hypothetical protein
VPTTAVFLDNFVIHLHAIPAAEHIQHQELGTPYRQQRLYSTRSTAVGRMYRYQPRFFHCAVDVLELCLGRMRVGRRLYGVLNLSYVVLISRDVIPLQGYALAQWLRHYVTNRKVAGSIPDGVIRIFH